jgi:large subunit ribosomal protein L22
VAVSAKVKNSGISARKIKLILDLIRGMNVDEALEMLRFMPSPAAAQVAKVVKSATANAENELLARTSDLRIVETYANEAPRLKRFIPRARGRANKMVRNSSHITVVVDEEETALGQ